MQPQNNPQSGFNLPPVAPEQVPPIPSQEVAQGLPEAAPAPAEFAPNPAAAVPPIAPPIVPQSNPLIVPPVATPIVTPTTATSVLPTTHDADLIEKEWVNKAKQIVERTRNDPHQQSKSLSGLKADYMQKRYSKEIKLGE